LKNTHPSVKSCAARAALGQRLKHFLDLKAVNAGHSDRKVREQTLPQALEWVWQGFPLQTMPK